jgi:cation transport regulator ChaC
MAYQLAAEEVDAVLEHLDFREKGGYSRHSVRLNFKSAEFADSDIDALIYIGTPDNPNYAGPASEEEIAAIAATAHGPSGSNVEYIIRLAEALQGMGAHDPHVFSIAELLRQ